MRVYLHGYTQRWRGIVVVIVCTIATIILSFALFYDQLYAVSGQLRYYQDSDYSHIYILNYSSKLENECIYPDVDICFYKDQDKRERIAASAIMKNENVDYSLECMAILQNLSVRNMVISENVARQYNLSAGSVIYAEVPYSDSLLKYEISSIGDIVFDYSNPSIVNDIGVVFVGYDKTYEESIQCKYILFSKKTEAERLAKLPQIIDRVINKTIQYDDVFGQGFALLLFQVGFGVITILAAHKIFFAQSRKKLVRCYLKGMKRDAIILIPCIEKVVLGLLVCVGTESLFFRQVRTSKFSLFFFAIPGLLWGAYCILSTILDVRYMRRRI